MVVKVLKKALLIILSFVLLILILYLFNNDKPSFFVEKFSKIHDNILNIKSMYYENKELKKRIEGINTLESQKQFLEKENSELEVLVKTTQKIKSKLQNVKLIQAEVIKRHSRTWNESLVINRGKKDGIKEFMTVMDSSGLIGRIEVVKDEFSIVQLLGSNRNSVSAVVEEKDNINGIINEYNFEDDLLLFSNINSNFEVKIGEKIITSGLGGVFPRGVLVGEVVNIQPDNFGLTQTATLKPAANFNDINHVIVLELN